MIKVSVIVPVWNVEDYLEKCLDSLAKQTLKDIEVLVVNDESPDNSQKIIDKFTKKYDFIKSFTKKNGGQGSARNLALKYAKGEYIGFVDSDDWIDLDMYESMYNKATEDKSDIVICDMTDNYVDKERYYDCTHYNNVYEKTPSACNKLFKKSFIGNLKFIEDRLWYEDFNFTTKLLFKKPKISLINKAYYHCYCREVSTMNNNNSIKNLDMLKILDNLKEYALENNCYDDNVFKYLVFDHVLITTINRVSEQNSDDKKNVIKELTNYCRVNIPDYKNMEFYKNIPQNRKIIARLNYLGLSSLSNLVLKLKSKI